MGAHFFLEYAHLLFISLRFFGKDINTVLSLSLSTKCWVIKVHRMPIKANPSMDFQNLIDYRAPFSMWVADTLFHPPEPMKSHFVSRQWVFSTYWSCHQLIVLQSISLDIYFLFLLITKWSLNCLVHPIVFMHAWRIRITTNHFG